VALAEAWAEAEAAAKVWEEARAAVKVWEEARAAVKVAAGIGKDTEVVCGALSRSLSTFLET
jgi:hypothetical protein